MQKRLRGGMRATQRAHHIQAFRDELSKLPLETVESVGYFHPDPASVFVRASGSASSPSASSAPTLSATESAALLALCAKSKPGPTDVKEALHLLHKFALFPSPPQHLMPHFSAAMETVSGQNAARRSIEVTERIVRELIHSDRAIARSPRFWNVICAAGMVSVVMDALKYVSHEEIFRWGEELFRWGGTSVLSDTVKSSAPGAPRVLSLLLDTFATVRPLPFSVECVDRVLEYAAWRGYADVVKKMLSMTPSQKGLHDALQAACAPSLSSLASSFVTAFHVDYFKTVNLLLSARAPINDLVLHDAAEKGNIEALRALLQSESAMQKLAFPTALDPFFFNFGTGFHRKRENATDLIRACLEVFHRFSEERQRDFVARAQKILCNIHHVEQGFVYEHSVLNVTSDAYALILAIPEFEVNAVVDGKTAMESAFEFQFAPGIQMLLAKGAKLPSITKRESFLRDAAQYGSVDTVRLLLQYTKFTHAQLQGAISNATRMMGTPTRKHEIYKTILQDLAAAQTKSKM